MFVMCLVLPPPRRVDHQYSPPRSIRIRHDFGTTSCCLSSSQLLTDVAFNQGLRDLPLLIFFYSQVLRRSIIPHLIPVEVEHVRLITTFLA